jgi:hypothetical protein
MQRISTFLTILLLLFLSACTQAPVKSPVESRTPEPVQRAPGPIQIIP